jgi:hypothetical protein
VCGCVYVLLILLLGASFPRGTLLGNMALYGSLHGSLNGSLHGSLDGSLNSSLDGALSVYCYHPA